jgi:hypothetical protein
LETDERNAAAAKAALLARLKSQPAGSTKMPWERDELYEKMTTRQESPFSSDVLSFGREGDCCDGGTVSAARFGLSGGV